MDEPEKSVTRTISVSRDALRADLAEMEIRLLDKLVSKSEHYDLVADVGKLDGLVHTKIAEMEGLFPLRDFYIKEHIDMKATQDAHSELIRGLQEQSRI